MTTRQPDEKTLQLWKQLLRIWLADAGVHHIDVSVEHHEVTINVWLRCPEVITGWTISQTDQFSKKLDEMTGLFIEVNFHAAPAQAVIVSR